MTKHDYSVLVEWAAEQGIEQHSVYFTSLKLKLKQYYPNFNETRFDKEYLKNRETMKERVA